MLYIPQIINFKYFFAHSNHQAYTLIIIKKFHDHNIYALIIIIMSHLFVFFIFMNFVFIRFYKCYTYVLSTEDILAINIFYPNHE